MVSADNNDGVYNDIAAKYMQELQKYLDEEGSEGSNRAT